MPFREVQSALKFGGPANQSLLRQVLGYWLKINELANPWLDSLTTEPLPKNYIKKDEQLSSRSIGSLLQKVIYHY